jgi:hypothetical protein
VVKEQTHQERIAPPLRGIGMSMFQEVGFFRRDGDPFFFLGAYAGRNVILLAFLVDVLTAPGAIPANGANALNLTLIPNAPGLMGNVNQGAKHRQVQVNGGRGIALIE